MKKGKATEIGPVTNGAKDMIEMSNPYIVDIGIEGTSDLLFHAWNVEEIEAKANAKKGSKQKKTDNIESYVYRDSNGMICIPGEYLRQSMIWAAKFAQDPRSPRKSAMDIFKAAIISNTELAPIGKDWDYEYKCRVVVQRAGITRTRPAFKAGWKANFQMLVNLPEYIQPAFFHEILTNAGKLIGLADFRPSYGRFMVTRFEVKPEN
jgi:hypothetical protein